MMSENGFSIPSSITGFAHQPNPNPNPNPTTAPSAKRKRNLPGTPDPDAEVIALSPKSLMATNRFICEICNKGFQRDQNLQLHRRGHNLPWKLRQRTNKEIRKKVYICPEKSCVHHDPSRALGDLTGIKKHFSRKHGEKKWKCDKCSKKYAVHSDWKAHTKICGTREYKCDCGTLFSRKDSFITHRAFCDALAEESARLTSVPAPTNITPNNFRNNNLINGPIGSLQAAGIPQFSAPFRPELHTSSVDPTGHLNEDGQKPRLPLWLDQPNSHLNPIGISGTNSNGYLCSNSTGLPELVQTNLFGLSSPPPPWLNQSASTNLSIPALPLGLKREDESKGNFSESMGTLLYSNSTNTQSSAHMSATALLQKAAQMGSTRSNPPAAAATALGVMNFNDNPNYSQNRNEIEDKFFGQQSQADQNLNELVNSMSSSSPINNINDGLFLGDSKSSSVTRGKLQRVSSNNIEVESSLTRDFLGVGGKDGAAGRPLIFQHELAKFASMGAAMDLSHYSNGNH
ncbi:zinc finger protein BALDIBIS-like [Malania oleifera]|uniref:zinc finger protein BALDIBIS-like n=1 Tax=Malania oleifera TaxID=397392 RepID=UPI0025ADEBA1|nr:zinc finger protein BALDIBIS-like [Malania oleifera]XP_057953708.1 zinc finger protein BALDIBIS-like [Malania oleifera]